MYFGRPSQLTVRVGSQTVLKQYLAGDFLLDLPLTGPPGPIVLETDQTYVPAERSSRTQDHRRLGLRMFRVWLTAS